MYVNFIDAQWENYVCCVALDLEFSKEKSYSDSEKKYKSIF